MTPAERSVIEAAKEWWTRAQCHLYFPAEPEFALIIALEALEEEEARNKIIDSTNYQRGVTQQ